MDTIAQHLCAGERPPPRDAQPLALGACDLGPELHERFLVCEKTDGVWQRVLGTAGGNWWGLDRRGRVSPLVVPEVPATSGTTLVDTETLPGGERRVFAAYWVDGADVRDLPTLEGLAAAGRLGLPTKRMRPVSEAADLVRSMSEAPGGHRTLGGDPVDGLIFTPRVRPASGVLKWKFTHTVDLQVSKSGELLCGGPRGSLLRLHGAAPPGTPPGIYEFDLGPEAQWRLLYRRTDKDRPNYVKVVVHTLEIMAQGITVERIAER